MLFMGEYQKNLFKHICLSGLCCFLFLLSACGSTSSGALPQASIPVDELITVSSPDDDGVVSISGLQGAVPDSSLVIIEISNETALNVDPSMDWMALTDYLMSAAHAQALCTSDENLPECSANISSGKCTVQSNADGSFDTQVTAALGQSLLISYLDPNNNCREREALRREVPEGVVAVALNGLAMTYNGASRNAFIFGLTQEGNQRVLVKNVETDVISPFTHTLDENLDGTIQGIHMMTASNDDLYLLKVTDQDMGLSFLDGTEAIDVDYLAPLDGTDVKTSGIVFERDFTYNALPPGCEGVPAELNGRQSDRGFVSRSIDPEGNLVETGHPIAIIEGALGGVPANPMRIRPIFFDYEQLGLSGEIQSVDKIVVYRNAAGKIRGYFIAKFKSSANIDRYFLVEIPLWNDVNDNPDYLCNALVNQPNNVKIFRLPLSLQSPTYLMPLINPDFLSDLGRAPLNSEGFMLITDSQADSVYVVDLDTPVINIGAVINNAVVDNALVGLDVENTNLTAMNKIHFLRSVNGSTPTLIGTGATDEFFRLKLDSVEGSIVGLNVPRLIEVNSDVKSGANVKQFEVINENTDEEAVLVLYGGNVNSANSFTSVIPASELRITD